MPALTLAACEFFCVCGPRHPAHETPSDAALAGEPTTWQTVQRRSMRTSAIVRIWPILFERASSSALNAFECLSGTDHSAYSLPQIRLLVSGSRLVLPW